MSSLSSSINRVPTLMGSQFFLGALTRTNLSLLDLQTRLATGRAITRPSDDAIRAHAIATLDDQIDRSAQRMRNLSAADAALTVLDTAVGEASDLVLEARAIASSQIGANSDAQTRRQQAIVVDSLIRQLFDLTNRQHAGLHLFGGSTPTQRPVVELSGGFRYLGRGTGLLTDLGPSDNIPITLGVDAAIGPLSSRLRSTVDLNPDLTLDTRLVDLRGARGLGASPGAVAFSFAGGPLRNVDLTGADTIGDIAAALTAAIRQYETDTGATLLGPAGVTVAGGSLRFDVVGAGAPPPELTFFDIGSGRTAGDLGLTESAFTAANQAGADLDPRLTLLTPLESLPGITVPLGSIRFRLTTSAGATVRDVDLSSARTLGDLQNLIQTGAPGVRVEINATGTGIDIFNEIAGPALSIENGPGGSTAATQLGIRSLSTETRLADFNFGRGVRIISGASHPITGDSTPDINADFSITLGNGTSFLVDLRPQDLASVQTVLDRINQQAAEAVADGLIPPGAITATLATDRNGIALVDNLGLGPIQVQRANNSPAAEDLGLLDGSWDAASATFTAQDRAGIRVDNLFSALISLRDALLANDSTGITLAGERLEADVDRIASTRALVGVHANRVQRATERLEDMNVLDERIRSELQDLDFTDAAIRLSLLQTQLQAGLQVTAISQSRSLLDFLR